MPLGKLVSTYLGNIVLQLALLSGIDLFHNQDLAKQKAQFAVFVRLALELGLPLQIHGRGGKGKCAISLLPYSGQPLIVCRLIMYRLRCST